MGAFLLPTSSSLCAPPLPSSVLGQHQPPGCQVRDAPSLDPVSSTSSSRRRPPPYFTWPLCTPPPLVFTWATLTTPLVKHPAPLNPSWGPHGSLGLPQPRAIPLPLSTPRVAPRSAPGYLRLSRLLPPPIRSVMVHPPPLLLARLWHLKHATPSPAWPGGLSFSSGLWPPALLPGPRGLGLGLYLPRLGCLGVPWCACGLLPYILSPPSPFTL